MESEQDEFVPLKDFEDSYEILNQYPYIIRKKDNHKIIHEYLHDYISVCLNNKMYLKHRLIAKQFIPNPNNLLYVDHINHIKTDNRIENLRFCTASENQLNKSSNLGVEYEFVDSISDDAITVNMYGNHQFENYFFHDNIFYFYNGLQYRKLYISESKTGFKIVNMLDVNGKRVRVYYTKFKKLYNLE